MRTRLGALHVRVMGDGPTAVLWPSMFVDSHTWDELVPMLPRDRRYVLVDGPGLGRSEALTRTATVEEAAGAAIDLLARLGTAAPVDWVGNAIGGHIGYKLGAMPGRLRSLVSISAPAEPIPRGIRTQIALLKPVLRLAGPVGPVRAAIVKAMITERAAADPAIYATVVDSIRRPSRRSLMHAIDSFILERGDVTDELGDIGVPCLFIASDDRGDWSPEDAEKAARLTPNATAVVVEGARTLIPLEKPIEVSRLVADFWAGVN